MTTFNAQLHAQFDQIEPSKLKDYALVREKNGNYQLVRKSWIYNIFKKVYPDNYDTIGNINQIVKKLQDTKGDVDFHLVSRLTHFLTTQGDEKSKSTPAAVVSQALLELRSKDHQVLQTDPFRRLINEASDFAREVPSSNLDDLLAGLQKISLRDLKVNIKGHESLQTLRNTVVQALVNKYDTAGWSLGDKAKLILGIEQLDKRLGTSGGEIEKYKTQILNQNPLPNLVKSLCRSLKGVPGYPKSDVATALRDLRGVSQLSGISGNKLIRPLKLIENAYVSALKAHPGQFSQEDVSDVLQAIEEFTRDCKVTVVPLNINPELIEKLPSDVRQTKLENVGLQEIPNGLEMLNNLAFPSRNQFVVVSPDLQKETAQKNLEVSLKELIQKNNLEPKYKIRAGDQDLYLSKAFGSEFFFTNPENGKKAYQKAVIGYIPKDGKLVPRAFYLSGNENLWRVSPVTPPLTRYAQMGKGLETKVEKEYFPIDDGIPVLSKPEKVFVSEPIRNTTNLPFELQIALHHLSENPNTSIYTDPSDKAKMSELKTLFFNIPEECDQKNVQHSNTQFAQEVTAQAQSRAAADIRDRPDFSLVERYKIPGIYSGDVEIFRVKSENNNYEYVFARATGHVRKQSDGTTFWKAKEPTTWLMSFNKLDQKITSYGCYGEQIRHDQVLSGVDHLGYHVRNYVEVPPDYFATAPSNYQDLEGKRFIPDEGSFANYPSPMKLECESMPLVQEFMKHFPVK